MKGGGKFQRMLNIFHYASVLLPYICMVCGILSVCVLFDPCFSLEHAFLYDVVIIPVTRVSIWERRVGRFVLTKLSMPPPVHSRTAAMHIPWLEKYLW